MGRWSVPRAARRVPVLRWAAALMAAALVLAGCVAGARTQPPPAAGAVAAVQWAFTRRGDQPDRLLMGVIASARSTLDVAVYSLTRAEIVRALLDAKRRGVAVRLITDRQEARGKSQAAALRILQEGGIPVRVNTHKGLMHLKVTIADGAVVTTGSFNYTTAASTVNDEVLVVIRDPAVALAWAAEFDRMWQDESDFGPL